MDLTIQEILQIFTQSDPSGGLVLNVDASNNDLSGILTTSNASGGRSVKVNMVSGPGMVYIGTANRTTVTGNVIDIAGTYVGQTSITTLGTISTGVWQGSAISDSYISSASFWNAKESALTFSTGLTRTTNTITNNVLTGKVGGQTWIGGTGTDDVLTVIGTSGIGTSTTASIKLKTGANGSVDCIYAYNDGKVVIGSNLVANEFRQLTIFGSGVHMSMGDNPAYAGLPSIYFLQLPSGDNYSLAGTQSGVTSLNCTDQITFRVSNAETMNMNSGGLKIANTKTFALGNAATTGLVAGALAALTTAKLVIQDQSGASFEIPANPI